MLSESTEDAMASSKVDNCVLYMNPFSVRSAMVRFALALRGQVRDGSASISVREQVVDIYTMEQLDQPYLFNVNEKGQVRASIAFGKIE
jgi:hypothetical protein